MISLTGKESPRGITVDKLVIIVIFVVVVVMITDEDDDDDGDDDDVLVRRHFLHNEDNWAVQMNHGIAKK